MNRTYKIKQPEFVSKYRYKGNKSLTIKNSPVEIDIHPTKGWSDEDEEQFYIHQNMCFKGRGTLDEMKELATNLYYEEIQKYLIEIE